MATTSPHDHGTNGAVVRQLKMEIAGSDLTAAELAAKVGMHPTVLSRYLTFKRQLTIGVIDQLAEGLGLDPMVLLRRSEERRK